MNKFEKERKTDGKEGKRMDGWLGGDWLKNDWRRVRRDGGTGEWMTRELIDTYMDKYKDLSP